ncbi:MAG TPA: hypothetical protein VFC46_04170 [Humisphaera sp.]|nr:hypothetical protein [Humisphaera sp.]
MRNTSRRCRTAWWLFGAWMGFALGAAGVAFAAEPPANLAKAVRDLGDDDFVNREKAQTILWRAGRAALPLLREAAKSDCPEVATRARSILRSFDAGIYPDMPADIVELLMQYRPGDGAAKARLLPPLLHSLETNSRCKHALGHLWLEEKDAGRREQIWNPIYHRYVDCPLEMVADGDEEDAVRVFRQLAVDESNYPSQRYVAAYFLKAGCLDAEIARVEREYQAAQTPGRASFLCEGYRVRGDLDRAWHFAQKSARAYELASLAEERGDYNGAVASIEAMPATGVYSWARLVWAASLYHHAGDQRHCDEKLNAIAAGDLSIERALSGWVVNDHPEEGMKRILGGLPQSTSINRKSAAMELLCYQWRFREAAERADKVDGRSPDALVPLAQKLYLFGARDKGLALLEELRARAQTHKDLALYPGVIKAFRELGLEERAVAIALEAQELPSKDSPLSDMTQLLFPECQGSPQDWWKLMSRMHPEASPRERVARLKSFFGGKASAEEATALIAEATRTPWPIEKSPIVWKSDFVRYTLRYGLEDSRLKDLAESAQGGDCLVVLGDEYAAKGHWERAAAAYEEAWERSRTDRFGDPILLIFYGRALEKAGHPDEGRELAARGHRMCIDINYYFSPFLSRLEERGLTDDAAEERDLLFRIAPPTNPVIGQVLGDRAERIAETNPLEAAKLWDTRLLRMCSDCTYFPNASFYMEFPRQIHQWRAQGLAQKQDDDGALREWRLCLAYQPFDTDAASGAVKVLMKLHRETEADAIYSQTRAGLERLCEEFPESATAHNALAWLAARSARDLDLALLHANQGCKLEPKAAAYMDTLAEVYRVRGDRKKALELMHKCIEIEPNVPLFKRRLAEFEAGK